MILTNTNNQIKKRTTISITVSIIVSIFLFSTIVSPSTFKAYGSSSDVGYQDGLSDCSSGTSDAMNGHSNAGHHSAAYMDAYNRGLTSCNNSNSNSGANSDNNNADNSGTTSTLGSQIGKFCENVNAGKYDIAVPIATLLGLGPAAAAIKGGCMGVGFSQWLDSTHNQ